MSTSGCNCNEDNEILLHLLLSLNKCFWWTKGISKFSILALLCSLYVCAWLLFKGGWLLSLRGLYSRIFNSVLSNLPGFSLQFCIWVKLWKLTLYPHEWNHCGCVQYNLPDVKGAYGQQISAGLRESIATPQFHPPLKLNHWLHKSSLATSWGG